MNTLTLQQANWLVYVGRPEGIGRRLMQPKIIQLNLYVSEEKRNSWIYIDTDATKEQCKQRVIDI